MIKEFTAEGRFECGFDELVRNKIAAFTAVIGENHPWRLGVAFANEDGYVPIPEHWCHATEGTDMKEFYDYVDRLNQEVFNLDPKEAVTIQASSMRSIPKRG